MSITKTAPILLASATHNQTNSQETQLPLHLLYVDIQSPIDPLYFTMTLSADLPQSVHPSQSNTIESLHGTSPCSVHCHGEDTAHTGI